MSNQQKQDEKAEKDEHDAQGPKYFVDIEGTEYPWNTNTITVPEIRKLGNLPADQAIIEIAADGGEITLGESVIVELKPGHRFGKKIRFKRG